MHVNFPGSAGNAGVAMLVVFAMWIVMAIIHIAFAVAVYRDADQLSLSRRLMFVSPGIWSLATLVGGLFAAAIYWAMHHSRLNPSVPAVAATVPETDDGTLRE
uniref:Uncharacterized protein n=1 Tax=Schlesneria paludicola TaxID=360056 RepID=A0A7C2P483_9PLAN